MRVLDLTIKSRVFKINKSYLLCSFKISPVNHLTRFDEFGSNKSYLILFFYLTLVLSLRPHTLSHTYTILSYISIPRHFPKILP